MTPSLLDVPPGCALRERWPYATENCAQDPEMRDLGMPDRGVRCFHPLQRAKAASPRDAGAAGATVSR